MRLLTPDNGNIPANIMNVEESSFPSPPVGSPWLEVNDLDAEVELQKGSFKKAAS